MSPLAFLLVTLSAFAHALWNFLGKRYRPSPPLFLAASLAAVLLFSPALFRWREGVCVMPPLAWGLLAATGLTQAIYYRALARAYQYGDLSLTYPLARALPVILVALASLVMGRARQIRALALPGFLLVTLGCLVLPLRHFRDIQPQAYHQPAIRAALLAAVCIAAYMLIDDQALRLLRSLPGSPLSSLEWALVWVEMETASLSLALLISVLLHAPERQELRRILQERWRFALALGAVITTAYALVLWAMSYARDVSYISAFRQLSIPIGAALGILFRKEPAPPPKLVGIGLIMLGLALAAVP